MKKRMFIYINLILMSLSMGLITSCSKNNSDPEGSGKATLRFSNIANQPLGLIRFLNLLDGIFFRKHLQ